MPSYLVIGANGGDALDTTDRLVCMDFVAFEAIVVSLAGQRRRWEYSGRDSGWTSTTVASYWARKTSRKTSHCIRFRRPEDGCPLPCSDRCSFRKWKPYLKKKHRWLSPVNFPHGHGKILSGETLTSRMIPTETLFQNHCRSAAAFTCVSANWAWNFRQLLSYILIFLTAAAASTRPKWSRLIIFIQIWVNHVYPYLSKLTLPTISVLFTAFSQYVLLIIWVMHIKPKYGWINYSFMGKLILACTDSVHKHTVCLPYSKQW